VKERKQFKNRNKITATKVHGKLWLKLKGMDVKSIVKIRCNKSLLSTN